MKVAGKQYRTIWIKPDDPAVIQVIDQRRLPHEFAVQDLKTVGDFQTAIREMTVRGAGLIGATAGYGMYIAALTAPRDRFDSFVQNAAKILTATRPTASNLAWAVKRQLAAMKQEKSVAGKIETARRTACAIAEEDAAFCRRIGGHGVKLIRDISAAKNGAPVHVLTHCNAGWLAFVDYGSATAPIYAAHEAGINVHVWVDETRPRSQGAALTAWELGQQGIDHHLIADNTGGHLMQHGLVDLVLVGTDRTTRNGDVANKIGTYLKALAARDNGVPFYVALPSSTFDFEMNDGLKQIPIEERDEREIRYVSGRTADGSVKEVLICPESTRAKNYGFDVTPARLITGLICERGICPASENGILSLFPEQRRSA